MYHYMFRPNWPSSDVQDAGWKEPAALLFIFDVNATTEQRNSRAAGSFTPGSYTPDEGQLGRNM
jgi:hypothetical protein